MHLSRLAAVSVVAVSLAALAQAPSPSPTPMRLRLNDQRLLMVPTLKSIAVADPATVDVKVVDGEVLVSGTAPGHTTLTFTATGAPQRRTLEVDVAPNLTSQPGAAPGITDVTPQATESLVLSPGGATQRTVPSLQRIAVGDADVADLRLSDDTVSVVGVRAGTTTVIAWLPGGRKLVWDVAVR